MSEMHIGENSISAIIGLDATHDVFKGHFPEQPVVPGVFHIQIIKEIMQEFAGAKLQLDTSKEIKFIQPITPVEFEELNVQIAIKEKTDTSIKFSAQIKNTRAVFLDYRGIYKMI